MKGKAKPVTGYSVGAIAAEGVEESEHAAAARRARDRDWRRSRGAVDAARMRQSTRRRARRRARRRQDAPRRGARHDRPRLPGAARALRAVRRVDAVRAASHAAATARRDPAGRLAGGSGREADGVRADGVMPDLAPWLPLLALPFDAEVAVDAGGRRDRRGVQARPPARGAGSDADAAAADADGARGRGHALARRRVAARARQARAARAAAVARRRDPAAVGHAARRRRRRCSSSSR